MLVVEALKDELLQMHRNFGHVSANRMYTLCREKLGRKASKDMIKKALAGCETCSKEVKLAC